MSDVTGGPRTPLADTARGVATPLPSATMQWIVLVVAAVVLLATYLTWMAGRIDRLHARAAASLQALDAALVRRAVVAIKLADQIDRPDLRRLAQAAIDAPDGEREIAENQLTKMVRELPAPTEIAAASRRVSLARHIHNDLVRDALALRRRRLVRLMGARRKHLAPAYFDIEDPQM